MLVCADQCPAAEHALSAVLPADAQMHVLEASAVFKAQVEAAAKGPEPGAVA